MHRSRLGALVIDSPESEDLVVNARFWGEALGTEPESGDEPVNPRYVRLGSGEDGPQLLLQRVDHAPRVHIDIETDDIEAEVARLEGLGATIVRRLDKWVVMEAPTGHRFCVIDPIRPDFADRANVWAD